MSYDLAWLQNPAAQRCILVEATAQVAGIETTFYLSTKGYITENGDTPSNTNYIPCIVGGLQITETLPLDGTPSLAYGDIEIQNLDGSKDAWLGYIWKNRTIRVYVGDRTWPRSSFQLIFNGVLEDIGSKSYDRLNFTIRDKLQLLNCPISEVTLGGSTTNANSLIPLVFGECCNITPLLSNPATLEYQVHNGQIERIIEVRDNGVPVIGFTSYLSTGKFTLSAAPAGIITASIQGDSPGGVYSNTVSKLIQRIVQDFGKVSTNFSSADLDAANLAAFEAANQQPVGVTISDRDNVITVIQKLATSVGAQPSNSREGKLRLLRIAFPPSGTPFAVTTRDMLDKSLYISDRTKVIAATKIGYCKNWTVEDNLQTGIPVEHKDLFSKEYLTVTVADPTITANYKLDNEPVERDTLLLTTNDADTEATRELNVFKVPRHIYSFVGFAPCFLIELGQAVTITHPRFGLASGATGIAVSLQTDWLQFTVQVGVLI